MCQGGKFIFKYNWRTHQKDPKQDSVRMGLNEENYPIKVYQRADFFYFNEQIFKRHYAPAEKSPQQDIHKREEFCVLAQPRVEGTRKTLRKTKNNKLKYRNLNFKYRNSYLPL